ncbi:MAG: C_GCAxxG_C_C family protein [Desulfomonile tiedjei]|nr:C_GCAxxG_C_C family protein [Desulfomonile tiedjei]
MNDVEKTVELFSSGLNCSQAVLTVFGQPHGLDSEMAKNLGRSLGGGMGHMARTCGAVTAAVLVLGLVNGNHDEGHARKVSFAKVQELFRRFETLHGTTDCRGLLGADMSTEAGLKKIQEEQLVRKLCPAFVRDAANTLEQLLQP